MSILFLVSLFLIVSVFLIIMSFDFTGSGFCGFIFAAGSFFLILAGSVKELAFKDIEYEYESRNVYSLTLNSKIDGEATFAFVIGYANVDEVPCYCLYEEHAGGMHLNTVSAQHSVLIESDDVAPHIEMPKYKKFTNPRWIGKVWRTKERLEELANGVDFYEMHRRDNGTIDWSYVKIDDDSMIRIYVPIGTIKKQFVADTSNL